MRMLDLALCVSLTLGSGVCAAADVQALLKAADLWRLGSDAMQVETLVTQFDPAGQAERERRYTVYTQPQRRSLVLMRSPAEVGQKVLMLGDDFWLLMPGSQRPLRITPSQKLLGDASTGDIATLSWADDYEATRGADGACPAPDEARLCTRLHLSALRKGLSYARIELWIGLERSEPVAAELYVQSDKLAKRARFITDGAAVPSRIDEMRLTDHLGKGRETRVRYLSRAPRQIPEAWLNPMFLARNPALQ